MGQSWRRASAKLAPPTLQTNRHAPEVSGASVKLLFSRTSSVPFFRFCASRFGFVRSPLACRLGPFWRPALVGGRGGWLQRKFCRISPSVSFLLLEFDSFSSSLQVPAEWYGCNRECSNVTHSVKSGVDLYTYTSLTCNTYHVVPLHSSEGPVEFFTFSRTEELATDPWVDSCESCTQSGRQTVVDLTRPCSSASLSIVHFPVGPTMSCRFPSVVVGTAFPRRSLSCLHTALVRTLSRLVSVSLHTWLNLVHGVPRKPGIWEILVSASALGCFVVVRF